MKNLSHTITNISITIILLLAIMGAIVISNTPVSADLQLYEHYNASWFDNYTACDTNWLGQTFTAASSHTVNAVKIYFSRPFCVPDPCNPGTIHAVIKRTADDGTPTGPVLSSGTINGDDFPVSYSWQTITMSEYNLTAGNRYVIILYNTSPCATGSFGWLIQDGSPYPDGNLIESNDSGATWIKRDSYDFNFEVWGGPIPDNPQEIPDYTFLSSDSSGSTPEHILSSAPPAITILNISSQPAIASAGQPVTIMANVVNRGEQTGNCSVLLKINDQIETSKQLTVPGNEAVPVEFTVYKEEPGNYAVDINGKKTYFSVTGQQQDNTDNIKNIAFIVLGVLVLSTVVIFIRYLSTR
jgi:hypothetical protein